MQATADSPKSELRERSPTEDSPDTSSPELSYVAGPIERAVAPLKIAALAICPTAIIGAAMAAIHFAFQPESPFDTFAGATIFAAELAGISLIARWLALGPVPFPDRAIAAPIVAAALGVLSQFAFGRFVEWPHPAIGFAILVAFSGIFGLYWAIASTFLARDGDRTRRRRRRTILDLSLAMLLLGLYAASLRWLLAAGGSQEEPVKTFVVWTGIFGGVALVPFGIDLAARFAVRSGWLWRAILAVVGLIVVAIGSAIVVHDAYTYNFIAGFVLLFSPIVAYAILSPILATLIEWRPRSGRDSSAPSGEPSAS